MCTPFWIKKCFAIIFGYVSMLLGIGGCYKNVPLSSPLIGHADRSEQTGRRHSK